jgi:Zn-dependent protease
MNGGFKIGRLFGIEVDVHPSWFIILLVFVWSLATTLFPQTYHWSTAVTWTVAVVAALLLFASVIVHELGHSLVARRQGIAVKNITLFVLGGVSSIEKEASSPRREALLAGSGPLVSLTIGVLALLLAYMPGEPQTVHAVLAYVGFMNVLLAVFNLLPGFPLDGGRVLRAILWARSGDFERATRGAARAGYVLGYTLIVLGILTAIGRNVLAGVWAGFTGWILVQAAQASYGQVVAQQRLAGVTAGSIATPAHVWIPPMVTLEAAANDYFLANNARCLPVEGADDTFDGIVCLSDLQHTPRSQWSHDRVADVMTPRDRVAALTSEAPAAEALRLMAERNINQVAIVDGDRLTGFVDRATALRHLRLHSLVGRRQA